MNFFSRRTFTLVLLMNNKVTADFVSPCVATTISITVSEGTDFCPG